MTAVYAWALQQALYEALRTNPAVTAIVGDRIVDNPVEALAPAGPAILLGEERIAPWGSSTDRGAEHRVTIVLVAPMGGFGVLKRLAASVSDAVLGPLTLNTGRIVLSRFIAGRAHRRGSDGLRRVDLQFLLVIEDDQPTQAGE